MMNLTSKQIRDQLKVFNTWRHRVSKTALLKDRIYTCPTPEEFMRNFEFACDKIDATFNNEEFDCDDFADVACSFIKLRRRKLSMHDGYERYAYPIWPCALSSKHTICICITELGIWFGEPQNKTTWDLKNNNNTIVMVG